MTRGRDYEILRVWTIWNSDDVIGSEVRFFSASKVMKILARYLAIGVYF